MGSILFSLIISIQKGSSWVFFLKSSVFLTLFFPVKLPHITWVILLLALCSEKATEETQAGIIPVKLRNFGFLLLGIWDLGELELS